MTSWSTSPVHLADAKNKPWLTATLALVFGFFFVISRPSHAEWLYETRGMMGTEITVSLWHTDPSVRDEAAAAVFAEMARIENMMSTYIESSLISKVNRSAADGAVYAGDELFSLIVRALDISTLTLGAFDITYDSVGQYYDFRERKRPDDQTIEQELANIDYQLVETDVARQSVRFLHEGVRINLGGIAKGYAVERGVEILRERGISNAIVTAGGDSRLLGDRLGKPWMIAVRDPRDDGKSAVTMPLIDEAISTSGDYERYFEEDGVRYHHIIQPDTGEPVEGVHSATIIGPDAVLTDALSTSVFVMGVDKGLKLISNLPDYEGIVIDADGQMYYSDGLQPPD